MNPITYHRATASDAPILTDNRVLFALELSGPQPEENIQMLRTQMTAYFAKATADNSCISIVAKYDGEIAGIGSMHIREMPGNFKNPSGKWGYIMNIYTIPAYRRKGICRTIMKVLEEEAVNAGVGALELHATPAGEFVYIQEGYVEFKEPTYRKLIKP